jgi:hypothetical protein
MPHRSRCSVCEKTAIAYVTEPDGTRTHICYNHIPVYDVDKDLPAPLEESDPRPTPYVVSVVWLRALLGRE